MPAPLNLVGRRFGKLVVIGRAEGKGKGGFWLCRCDCGAEEVFPAYRLPHAEYVARLRRDVLSACSTCMHTRTCAACGKPFVSRQFKATCSDECFIVHRRAKDLQHYYKQAAADPDYNRGRWRAAVERMQDDPERLRAFYDRTNAAKQRSRERRNADPERRQAAIDRQRRWCASRCDRSARCNIFVDSRYY